MQIFIREQCIYVGWKEQDKVEARGSRALIGSQLQKCGTSTKTTVLK
jgi:hypothetical protein